MVVDALEIDHMSSGINEGQFNLLTVQAEDSFTGTLTGTAYHIRGRMGFSYQPMLSGGAQSVNVWRHQDGDSFAARFYQGSIEMEYSHGEAFALLLASLMKRSGTSPNYTFEPSHNSKRQTIAIGLSYLPNDVHWIFRGVMIETMTLNVRRTELAKVRMDFKAAIKTDDGPMTATEQAHVPATHLGGAGEFGSQALTQATEMNAQIAHRIAFANFNEDKEPTEYEPDGQFSLSGDFAEWMSDDEPAGHRVAEAVEDQTESNYFLQIVPAAGKVFQITVPRVLVRNGTPAGLAVGGIAYRAGTEAQVSEDRSDVPVISMVL